MRRIALLWMAAFLSAGCEEPTQPNSEVTANGPGIQAAGQNAPTVWVAAPTGNPAIDVPNIRAAVNAATPGALIQFARGTYAITGETQFVVTPPGVTLQGDPHGTTIRGVTYCCPPDGSGHFLLSAGHQTVRRLNFEGFTFALSLGAPGSTLGGYRLEHNSFRNGHVAFEFISFSDDVSTVEGNEFINVTTAFLALGKTVHFRGNRLTMPDPTQTPLGQLIQAAAFGPEIFSGGTICENNVVEDNTVVGYNDGILFLTFGPGDSCRNNVVRNNQFVQMRIFDIFAPLFDNGSMVFFLGPGEHQNNLVQRNVLKGSEGVGLVLETGSGNRIVDNEFRDLPGEKETYSGSPGTAIILGASTTGNRVSKNEFKNVVNAIVDLGSGNIINDQLKARSVAVSSRELSLARRQSQNPMLRLPGYSKPRR